MRIRHRLRSTIAAVGLTFLSTLVLGATPTPASAGVVPVFPLCNGAHSGSTSVDLCINSVTATPMGGGMLGEVVTSAGTLTVCSPSCRVFKFGAATTGVGVNPDDIVPAITPGPAVGVPIPVTLCVGTIYCTPAKEWVPTYNITLFPSAPVAMICIDGSCNPAPLAPLPVTDEVGNILAAFSAS